MFLESIGFLTAALIAINVLAYRQNIPPPEKFKIQSDPVSGELKLLGPDCHLLQSELSSLVSWSVSRGEPKSVPDLQCEKNPDLKLVSIEALIPEKARNLHSKAPMCNGPNCWNAALVESDVLSKLRFSHHHEFSYFLKTHCKLLDGSKGEVPSPGDVGAIRFRIGEDSWEEMHAFTFIGNLAFSKNGFSRMQPWAIQNLSTVYHHFGYRENKECMQPNISKIPKQCTHFVSFYHCDKKAEFEDEDLLRLEEAVSTCVLTGQVTGSELIDPAQVKRILDVLYSTIESDPTRDSVLHESLVRQYEMLIKDHKNESK